MVLSSNDISVQRPLFLLQLAQPLNLNLDHTELYETEFKVRKVLDKLKLLANPHIRTRFLDQWEEREMSWMYGTWCERSRWVAKDQEDGARVPWFRGLWDEIGEDYNKVVEDYRGSYLSGSG